MTAYLHMSFKFDIRRSYMLEKEVWTDVRRQLLPWEPGLLMLWCLKTFRKYFKSYTPLVSWLWIFVSPVPVEPLWSSVLRPPNYSFPYVIFLSALLVLPIPSRFKSSIPTLSVNYEATCTVLRILFFFFKSPLWMSSLPPCVRFKKKCVEHCRCTQKCAKFVAGSEWRLLRTRAFCYEVMT